MNKNPIKSSAGPPDTRNRPPGIPLSAIRRYARQIAERFQPDKIILFGSYAYGKPDSESDVDLLVVMPAADMVNQAVRITLACDPPFPLDLMVRTPKYLQRRIQDADWFLREIVSKGKVLYEKDDKGMDPEGRKRLARRGQAQSNCASRSRDVS